MALALVVVAIGVVPCHGWQSPLLHHQQALRLTSIRGAREPLRAAATITSSSPSETSEGMSTVEMPGSAKSLWEVHKFGGASLETAALYRQVGDLLEAEAQGRGAGAIPTMAVVSAMGGMTDRLIKVVESALEDIEKAKTLLEAAVQRQIDTVRELAPPDIARPVEERIRNDARDIQSVMLSLKLIRSVPAVTMELVTGFGEIWSAQTLFAYLKAKGLPCDWVDARDILVVQSELTGLGEKGSAATGGVRPLWAETSARMAKWWSEQGKSMGFHDLDYASHSPIIVVTGFVATTQQGVPTTLKRSVKSQIDHGLHTIPFRI